jgi:hypothetical protein
MILRPCDEQEGLFFGPGGILENAANAHPVVNSSAPLLRRLVQKVRIAQVHKLLLGFAVAALILAVASNTLMTVADQKMTEGSEAIVAHVGSDYPAMGTELYFYEVEDYPAEFVTVIEYSDGSRRYFYTGNDPSTPAGDQTITDDQLIMAADDE